MTRQLHLNAFLMGTGHHEASWRLPESDPVATTSVKHFQRLAQIAERGTFDSLFLADGPVMFGNVAQRPSGVIEPLTLLTALALVTEHVGLIATASTSYNSPYNLARRFSALDHVSGGRAGWNIVTTSGVEAAKNFGVDEQPLHADRYARAAEFIDVALKLWDSWEDDVFVGDKAAGVWGDSSKIHPAAHKGKYFSVAGALNSPRSPQAYPLLVQAGSSDDGKDLAARYAEAVFIAHQTLADAQAFYGDLKSRTHHEGRDPNAIKILPGIVPVLGGTESEAKRTRRNSKSTLSTNTVSACCRDSSGYRSNSLTSTASCPTTFRPKARSRTSRVATRSSSNSGVASMTMRQLIGRLGGGRGHFTFAGTPSRSPTHRALVHQRRRGRIQIMPPLLPSGLELFVEHVVPSFAIAGCSAASTRARPCAITTDLPVRRISTCAS